jgi:hypothetical protein
VPTVTCSIPAAIDYLFTTISGLPECASPVIVEDGWPTRSGPKGVGIGVIPGDGTTEDEVTEAQLGAQAEYEEFAIPCIVWAHVGQPVAKDARDQAFVIFNAILGKLRENPAGLTLGGALHSGTARVRDWRIVQTDTVEESGSGRMCEIRFNIKCKNRL